MERTVAKNLLQEEILDIWYLKKGIISSYILVQVNDGILDLICHIYENI